MFNDSAYRVLGVYERVRFSDVTGSLIRLPSIDFALLARSLGAEGITITRRENSSHYLWMPLILIRPW
ncbi:hypothetical protein JCM16161A_19490 [Vulcanisaeta sp. JCM 16161]